MEKFLAILGISVCILFVLPLVICPIYDWYHDATINVARWNRLCQEKFTTWDWMWSDEQILSDKLINGCLEYKIKESK